MRQNTSVRLILHIYKSTEIPENPLAETANVWYNTKTVSMPSFRLGVYALVAHIHSGVAEFLPQQCCRRCFYVRAD